MQTKQKSQSSGNPKEKQKVIEEDKTIKTFTSVTAIQWEGLPNSSRLYSPRFDHAVTRRRNKIYLFGGDTGNVYFKNQFLADLHEYDLEFDKWKLIRAKSTGPCARAGHSLVYHRKRLHVFGGVGSTGKLDDFWSYDPDLNIWGKRSLNGAMIPLARSHHSALLYKDNLIVYGGSSYEGNGVVWNLDMISKTWIMLCPGDGHYERQRIPLSKAISDQTSEESLEYPCARAMHRAVIVDDIMYIFGGVLINPNSKVDEITNELWCFNLNTKIWNNMISKNQAFWPQPRAGHATIMIGHRWVIHGGRAHFPILPQGENVFHGTVFDDSLKNPEVQNCPETAITLSTPSSSVFLPLECQMPLGDVWAFNFSIQRWELLSGCSGHMSQLIIKEDQSKSAETDSIASAFMFCQPSRWGHDLLMLKKKPSSSTLTVDKDSNMGERLKRIIMITGGVSLAPLPLY